MSHCLGCGVWIEDPERQCCSRSCSQLHRHRQAGNAVRDEPIKYDEHGERIYTVKDLREIFWLDERRPAKYVAKTLAECEDLNKEKGETDG